MDYGRILEKLTLLGIAAGLFVAALTATHHSHPKPCPHAQACLSDSLWPTAQPYVLGAVCGAVAGAAIALCAIAILKRTRRGR